MNGDIYEGMLRPGDVGLDAERAAFFRQFEPKHRLEELQRMFKEQGGLASDLGGVSRQMPKYKCHKEVWALKIAEVRPIPFTPQPTIAELERLLNASEPIPESVRMTPSGEVVNGGALIVPAEEGFAPFEVNQEYMTRHRPSVGGYFVVYADGYKSYSPAKAFEEGYTRITG